MDSNDLGRSPDGSGHSPKGGAASSTASPAQPSVPNAAQFTPAPWDCTGCSFPDDGMGGVYYRVQALGIDASSANARLIAAAPELYEAARLMVEAGNMSPFDDRVNGAMAKAFDAAEAAIGRARGDA